MATPPSKRSRHSAPKKKGNSKSKTKSCTNSNDNSRIVGQAHGRPEIIRMCELEQVFPSVIIDEIFYFLIPQDLKADKSTKDLHLVVSEHVIPDINSVLVGICLKCPKLEMLTIVDYGDSVNRHKVKNIDFARLYFPHLQDLSLTGIGLEEFVISDRNVPNLQELSMEEMEGCITKWQVSGLTNLKSLDFNYTEILDNAGFQSFMLNMPNLETFNGYKLRCLSKQVWYLPKCERVNLERCEDLDSLVIAFAPKLTELSVQACYRCEYIRIYNCLDANRFQNLMVCIQFVICHMHEFSLLVLKLCV